jgi:hypothetical protein
MPSAPSNRLLVVQQLAEPVVVPLDQSDVGDLPRISSRPATCDDYPGHIPWRSSDAPSDNPA